MNARRGGLVHGTKVATSRGWKPVELIRAGDHVRTLENGFKTVSRVSSDCISVPTDEANIENLPVRLPSNVAYNGRPVWLMPEQGVALGSTRLESDPITLPVSFHVVPARVLSGLFRIKSDTPASYFDVTTLFFGDDEVIYIEGGLRAFCPSGRFGSSGGASYNVADSDAAANWARRIGDRGDISVIASSLGALPAPILQDSIMPIRPVLGARRPGRPGRPASMV
ncbi:Hint domain-containing protein [Ruegeria halocynthiae]|uniref:Hint domain-containing protein n=1 Tax=Ruegeria halocynthiae TaxID=985054 RepID=UPI001F1C8D1F|nr:Hint domain-containing protein [Ruegeria halocynthiae]